MIFIIINNIVIVVIIIYYFYYYYFVLNFILFQVMHGLMAVNGGHHAFGFGNLDLGHVY